jgi:hypothetical protein
MTSAVSSRVSMHRAQNRTHGRTSGARCGSESSSRSSFPMRGLFADAPGLGTLDRVPLKGATVRASAHPFSPSFDTCVSGGSLPPLNSANRSTSATGPLRAPSSL